MKVKLRLYTVRIQSVLRANTMLECSLDNGALGQSNSHLSYLLPYLFDLRRPSKYATLGHFAHKL